MPSTAQLHTESEIRTTLIAARERISEPEHWTQGRSARNAAGQAVGHNSPDAVAYCALGALAWAANWTVGRDPRSLTLYDQAAKALKGKETNLLIGHFNDSHTHAEVLALFDRAIARLTPSSAEPPNGEPTNG